MTTNRTPAQRKTPATDTAAAEPTPQPDKTYVLKQNKVTKGAVRYADGDGHSLYFRKEDLAVEGHSGQIPTEVRVDATFVW